MEPFFIFDASGGLLLCATKTHSGLIISGSGCALDRAQLKRFMDWLEVKPGDPIESCPA